MKTIRSIALAIAVGAICTPALADQDSQHQGHHPSTSTEAAKEIAPTPASTPVPARPNRDMADMDAQMKAMHEMHQKMMAAKTPEQRKALMAEHMKLMQGGMSMMSEMSPGGAKCDMGEHQQQMEKRMQMMQSMMQMMMDRMSAAPKD